MSTESAEQHSVPTLLTIAGIYGFVYAGAAPFQIFVTPHLRRNLGFGEIEAAMVLACVYFTFWLTRVAGGRIVPAIGVRRSVTAGVLGYVLFPMALAWLGAPAPMWVAACAWGFCASVFRVGASSTQLAYCRADRYGFWAGVGAIVLQVGTVAGLAVQVALSGGAARTSGAVFAHQACFASGAAVVAVVLSLALREVRGEFPRPSVREMIGHALSRRIWLLSVFMLSAGFGYGIILNTMNRIVRESWGLMGLAPFYVVAGVVSFAGGHISDRIGRGRCFVAAFALGAAGLAVVAVRQDIWSMALGAGILGAVFGLVPTLATAWIGDTAAPEERPLLISAVFSWRDLGIAVALIARGLAARLPHPVTTTFVVFAAWYGACAVLGAVRMRTIDAAAEGHPH